MELFNYYLIKELSKTHNCWVYTNCNKFDGKYKILRTNKKNCGNETLSLYINLFLETFKIRREIEIIIVPYTSNSHLVYPLLLITKLLKIPYIIIIHGGGLYPWNPEFIHKNFFEGAAEIVAVSKPIKEEYENRVDKEIRLIPPLIPFEKSELSKEELKGKLGFSNEDKILISVGSIKKIKGSDILLKAFFNLGSSYVKENKIKLLFVGDGPLKKSLEDKVSKKMEFKGHVKFLGNIPHNEINNIYKMADIYVIPSLFEGTPLSLLEAMYNALPIISSDINGINDIITPEINGMLFVSENTEDLTLRIKEMIDNLVSSHELGLKAEKDYHAKYNFNNVVSKYNHIINNIIRDEKK